MGTENELFERAKQNRGHAYSKYSGFSVGAVVELQDGVIFDGCNVENGSYGLTMCAERSALFAAVFGGAQPNQVAKIAIAGPDGVPCPPCGACRQVMLELAPHAIVSFIDDKLKPQTMSVSDLLPAAYSSPP
jgi:cytidine deaminase